MGAGALRGMGRKLFTNWHGSVFRMLQTWVTGGAVQEADHGMQVSLQDVYEGPSLIHQHLWKRAKGSKSQPRGGPSCKTGPVPA